MFRVDFGTFCRVAGWQMCDGGVSIPPWSVIIGPPRSVIIGGNRVDKESRLCSRSTKNSMFLLGHVMPKRNMPLLGHLETVLRLDGTFVWTEG